MAYRDILVIGDIELCVSRDLWAGPNIPTVEKNLSNIWNLVL